MIYAIQSGEFVKLGYSKDPLKRLCEIQVSSPIECALLGVLSGPPEREKLVHKRFAEFRVSGEWFKLNEILTEWIDTNMRPFYSPPSKPQPQSRGTVDEQEIVIKAPDDGFWSLPVSEQAFNLLSHAIENEGWSINRIAQEAGVSRVGLQRWYSGSRSSINMETFDGLCRWLGVTLTKTKIEKSKVTNYKKPTKRVAVVNPSGSASN
jgi:DNA-binding Xre family transcriptional regulator